MNDNLTRILDEIDQLHTAWRIEISDDKPNEKTLLAIKARLRSLDDAASRRMVLR